jgi:hypothetical protein
MKLFGCYYLVQNFDFFINWVPESPRFSLPKTSKQPLPAFTPSISGKTRGDREKCLWYLDSAPVNYPRSDSLVLAFWLAVTCVTLIFNEIETADIALFLIQVEIVLLTFLTINKIYCTVLKSLWINSGETGRFFRNNGGVLNYIWIFIKICLE